MKAAVLLAFVLACSKGNARCKLLAPRLMPDPKPEFIEACGDNYDSDPAFARTVECLLAIDHPLYDDDLASCPGNELLRAMYFHF
jgi:hypothetical protein